MITSAPVSLDQDLNRRQTRYLAMMSVRVACFIAAVFLPGIWRWVAVAGAAFLPAIAVVIANTIDLRAKKDGTVPEVTPLVTESPALEAPPPPAAPLVIPADADPEQHTRDDTGTRSTRAPAGPPGPTGPARPGDEPGEGDRRH